MARTIPTAAKVREHGRAAVAQKRRHDPRQREEAQQPAGDDERLHHQPERHAHRQQRRKVAGRPQRHAKAPPAQQTVQREDDQQSDQPELLADGGEDEVGVAGWNQLRIAQTRTGAPRRTGGQRPQPLRNLIAARYAVVPGVRSRWRRAAAPSLETRAGTLP